MEQAHAGEQAWYVAYCQPLKERVVGAALGSQLSLNVYLPELRRGSQGREQRMVLFPRYLFVEANLQIVPMAKLSAVQGILGLVSFGNGPQTLPGAVIEQLRQRVEHLNEQGCGWVPGLERGDTVRIQRGPLRGLEAVFVGPLPPRDRVRVLIEFLGQQRVAEVTAADLAQGGAGAARPRRTRGRGRPIRSA